MKGSVIKKRGKWYVVTEGPRDPTTGKRKRIWSTGFNTKREAECARIDILNRMQKGEYSTPTKITFGAFLLEWLTASQGQYKPGTFSVMKRHLENHVISSVGSIKLQDLHTVNLNNLYKELSQTGNLIDSSGLSISTIRGIHAYIRKALGTAEKWGYIFRNPAINAELPKDFSISSKGADIWTRDELLKFLEASEAADDKYYSLWLLLATTGLRRGEALGLEWRDIDLDKGRCTIRQTLGCVDHQPVIQTPKTKSSARTIAIPAKTITALRRQRIWQNENRLANPGIWDRSNDLVFTHEDGRLLHPERVFKEFQRRSERYGVRLVTLHDLRHGWATYAAKVGVSPNVMKEHLGHASFAITMDIYSHVLIEQDESAAQDVADSIFLGA